MKKFKVLLIIYKLEVAGAERVITDLAKGLNRELFNPVVCSFKGGPLVDEIKDAGIPIYILEKKGRFDLRFPFRLMEVLRKEKVDIIHAHMFSPNFWGCALGRISGVPVIFVTQHNVCGGKKRWQKIIDRILAVLATKILAVSEQVRQTHIEEEKIDPGKIVTVHNGIEGFKGRKPLEHEEKIAIKKKLGLNPDSPLFVNMARLEPQKGHKYLLAAIKLVIKKQPEVQFLIVGDGSQKKGLEALSKELGIDKYVFFPGFRSDIFELLEIADVSVMSSTREGFSIALLETMAAGKPVVATEVGGNPEVIKNGVNGFLVPARDPVALAESILKLIKNPKLISEMGMNALKSFQNHFTVNKMVEKTQELYLSQTSLFPGGKVYLKSINQ